MSSFPQLWHFTKQPSLSPRPYHNATLSMVIQKPPDCWHRVYFKGNRLPSKARKHMQLERWGTSKREETRSELDRIRSQVKPRFFNFLFSTYGRGRELRYSCWSHFSWSRNISISFKRGAGWTVYAIRVLLLQVQMCRLFFIVVGKYLFTKKMAGMNSIVSWNDASVLRDFHRHCTFSCFTVSVPNETALKKCLCHHHAAAWAEVAFSLFNIVTRPGLCFWVLFCHKLLELCTFCHILGVAVYRFLDIAEMIAEWSRVISSAFAEKDIQRPRPD